MSNEGITGADVNVQSAQDSVRASLQDADRRARIANALGSAYHITQTAMDRLCSQIDLEKSELNHQLTLARREVQDAHQATKELRFARKRANRERGKQGETIHALKLEVSHNRAQAKKAVALQFEVADYRAALERTETKWAATIEKNTEQAELIDRLQKGARERVATIQTLEEAVSTMRDIARGREQVITNLKKEAARLEAQNSELQGLTGEADAKRIELLRKANSNQVDIISRLERETAKNLELIQSLTIQLNHMTTLAEDRRKHSGRQNQELTKALADANKTVANQADMISRVSDLHHRSPSGQEACAHDGQHWPCQTRVVLFLAPPSQIPERWAKSYAYSKLGDDQMAKVLAADPVVNVHHGVASAEVPMKVSIPGIDGTLSEVLGKLVLTLQKMNDISEETLT